MSDNVRAEAAKALEMVEELNRAILPVPSRGRSLRARPTRSARRDRRRMAEIDVTNTGSIVAFGSSAQAELQQISQFMLQDVRNKDVGPAGDAAPDRLDDPGLLGQRARRAAQADVVGETDRARPRRWPSSRRATRGAGPDRPDHREPAEPRAQVDEGHQVARRSL
jgi:hypothetical protein